MAVGVHSGAQGAGEYVRLIAEMLDETGYLTVPLDDIPQSSGEPMALVEQALALVQDLDPAGVGARSLAECLALQARAALPALRRRAAGSWKTVTRERNRNSA